MELKDRQLPQALVETNLAPWPKYSGKVRDIYDLGEHLLLVATDRISCYDSVLASGIPCKGRILTALSLFWFDFLKNVSPNHLTGLPLDAVEGLSEYADLLDARSMIARKAEVIPIECIVRGYITGSGWKSYKQTGQICGINLPTGLKESEKLAEPLFTPTTKATEGHDEDITIEAAADAVGTDTIETIRDKSIETYIKARDYAAGKGLIIADTKFEFGIAQGEIILIDEVLTPDSSRFWPADDYQPGRAQSSFDKQYVRDYLDEIGWDRTPPAPGLPDDVVLNTLEKYVEAYERLTETKFKL